MLAFIATCLGILTAVHLAALIFWIVVAVQMRRAAQAVEVLAYRTNDQVERLGEATHRVGDFAGVFRAGWLRALTVAFGVAATVWGRRRSGERVHADGGV